MFAISAADLATLRNIVGSYSKVILNLEIFLHKEDVLEIIIIGIEEVIEILIMEGETLIMQEIHITEKGGNNTCRNCGAVESNNINSVTQLSFNQTTAQNNNKGGNLN